MRTTALVPSAAAFADSGQTEKPVCDFAIMMDVALSSDMSIVPIMKLFDSSAAHDLAVVDAKGRIVGMLPERYVRKRYANELDRAQRVRIDLARRHPSAMRCSTFEVGNFRN